MARMLLPQHTLESISRALIGMSVGLCLLLCPQAGFAEETKAGISARPIVAPPALNRQPLSSVYAQDGKAPLSSAGITVQEQKPLDMQLDDELDDYDSEPLASIADPLEPWNRFWFEFNDIFYMYVANPAYSAWEAVTPRQLRTGISNIWNNLLFPMRFINNLLQFRFQEAGVEFGRFIINTTAGLGGLVDVAKREKTIVPVDPDGEDFGQTLGRWGIPHGFYLVLPFYGPASARELVGLAGDYFLYPAFAASYVLHPWYVPSGIQVGFFFNDLDDVLPLYLDLRKAAVDPYIMMREAYVKYRAIQVAR